MNHVSSRFAVPLRLCAAAQLALFADSATAALPALPLAECLRADRVERWQAHGERALLIQSGARHFRLELRRACPDLGRGGILSLSGAQGTRDFICGKIGENINARYGDCAIGTVFPLSREEFLRQVQNAR